MENNELSKVKYIYRIYEAHDGLLHLQKYPVIYINKKYVYFKTAKSDKLDFILIGNVVSDFYKTYKSKYYTYNITAKFDEYFWDYNDSIQELFLELKEKRYSVLNQRRLESLQKKYEEAKKEYIEFLKIGKSRKEYLEILRTNYEEAKKEYMDFFKK